MWIIDAVVVNGRILKFYKKILFKFYFVRHNLCVDWPEIEPGPLW
jgi:hypothetical protein